MRVARFGQAVLAFGVFFLGLPEKAESYAVLAHQALIDTLWAGPITKVIRMRYPDVTDEQLKDAHAYCYGGSILQDLGYYPFGNHFFSDLLHYVRSADFLQALLDESHDVNEYAFALGAVSHYGADTEGHALAVNPTVPMLYPKLRKKFGPIVTYADDPKSHLKTEFGFDVLQVARGHYAPQAYHDFIGFNVAKDLIERAFADTYDVKIEDFYKNFDISIKTYRFSVSKVLPEMTRAAWSLKRKELQARMPGLDKKQFVYNLRRAAYEKDWGNDYQRPGFGARLLALIFRLVPKIGPFSGLGFKVPPPQAERMFETSFDAAINRNTRSYAQAGVGILRLPNRDLDTGKPTSRGEYELTDKTYDKLLAMLAAKGFAGVSPELRRNMLQFYGGMRGPDVHGMAPAVEALRASGN